MLTDTHAHLFWESFKEDFDAIIKRSLDAGVTTIINVGTDLETSQKALNQVENELAKYPNLNTYSSIGIHPHDAVKFVDNPDESIRGAVEKLDKIYLKNPQKVVAVGECGLDFMFESNPDFIPSTLSFDQVKELQRKLLKAQVELAKKLNLPLLIHTRDSTSTGLSTLSSRPKDSVPTAWNEIWDFIKDHYGILHCYSGNMETTKKALDSKFLVSFAGTITYPKNEYLREATKFLPLEKIVLETDCPFLPPQSKRGQRNEPSAVKEIAKLVAEIKNLTLDEIAVQTTKNVKSILKLKS